MITQLPPELLVAILEQLPFRDILTCKLVCRGLRDLVASSTSSIQYKIELAAAGLQDNAEYPHARGLKRPLLQKYQAGWSNKETFRARQANTAVIPIEDGPAWELAGGVLGQSMGYRSVRFHQLGAEVRGVPNKTWDVEMDFMVRDFTMDPGQDLLVALRTPQALTNYSLNFLSMSTGRPHPSARSSSLSLPFTQAEDFEIRVNGPYVGLLVMHALNNHQEWWSLITFWNWRTGERIFQQSEEQEIAYSFAFLDQKYVLLANIMSYDDSGALSVIDLSQPDIPWRIIFQLPRLLDSAMIESMELLNDPGPHWIPNAQVTINKEPSQTVSQPPFFVAHEDRVVVLMMTVMDEQSPNLDPYTIRFAILTSRLLDIIRNVGREVNPIEPLYFPWTEWGPASTRVEPRNDIWDGSWPCAVYGTRYVSERSCVRYADGTCRRYRPVSIEPPNYDLVVGPIEVYDFNQARVRKALLDAGVPGPQTLSAYLGAMQPVDCQDVEPLDIGDGYNYYLQPTYLPQDFKKFFADPREIVSRILYRVCSTRITPDLHENPLQAPLPAVETDDPDSPVDVGLINSVMLSEDSIVVVREWPETKADFLVITLQ